MIEYLLVLTLTAALVLAVSKGVGRPLQEYIQNNILDMVGCMLRVGQFPTKSFGLCQEAIRVRMDVAGNFDASGSGSSSDSSNNSNNDSSDSDSDNNTNGSESDSDNSDSSNRTRVRRNGSSGSLSDSGSDSSFGNGSTKRIKISNDDSEAGNIEIGKGQGTNFGETTVVVRRIRREDGRIGGSFFIEKDKKSGDDAGGPETYQATTTQNNIRSEFDVGPTGKSFMIPKANNRGPSGVTKEEKVDFSFLGMIKWLIIIAVLFFIIVFAASQLNSIRKGWTD